MMFVKSFILVNYVIFGNVNCNSNHIVIRNKIKPRLHRMKMSGVLLISGMVAMAFGQAANAQGKPAHVDITATISEVTCDLSTSVPVVSLGNFNKASFVTAKGDVGARTFKVIASNCLSGGADTPPAAQGDLVAQVDLPTAMAIPGDEDMFNSNGSNDVGISLKGAVYDPGAHGAGTLSYLKGGELLFIHKADNITDTVGKQFNSKSADVTASIRAVAAATASPQRISVPVNFTAYYQ